MDNDDNMDKDPTEGQSTIYNQSNGLNKEDVEELVTQIEKRAQSRPIYKFGVLTLGVAIGSYLGVGRHVLKVHKQLRAFGEGFDAVNEVIESNRLRSSLFDEVFGPKKH